MSVFFERVDNGDVLWNPSQRAGSLFVALTRATADTFDLASGIGEIVSDTVQVDPAALAEFVNALARELESRHAALQAELTGPLAIAIVLLRRCGVAPTLVSSLAESSTYAERLDASMPR